ncbi:hypothetical protein ACFVQB_27800 [Paenibacillus sp. NPDC057886]|uniref:hypothetical protein n=1 Tax=Paenibacillus sp. NPDC057886 TaxID=3346270 RepID=UPI0036C14D70
MKGIQKVIDIVQNESPILQLIELGITPEQIKEDVIDKLGRFFVNKDKLIKYSTANLVSDWIHFGKYRNDDFFISILIQSLEMYRTAMNCNSNVCVEIITSLLNEHAESDNRLWSFLLTQNDKNEFDFHEYVETVINDIGRIIEGLSKSVLIEFLCMNKLVNGKVVEIQSVMKQDLGVINSELLLDASFVDIFSIRGLKLSDWRNIAYHHSYRIKGENVWCEYGSKQNRKTIILAKEELWETLQSVVKTLDLLNLTHKLFLCDNEDSILLTNCDFELVDSEIRPEIWFITLASSISAQGFKIIDFITNKECTKLVLRELIIESDAETRAFHSSQFTYNLWYYSLSEKLEVEYRLPNNQVYLISSTTSEVCEKVEDEEKGIEYLAEHIELNFIEY